MTQDSLSFPGAIQEDFSFPSSAAGLCSGALTSKLLVGMSESSQFPKLSVSWECIVHTQPFCRDFDVRGIVWISKQCCAGLPLGEIPTRISTGPWDGDSGALGFHLTELWGWGWSPDAKKLLQGTASIEEQALLAVLVGNHFPHGSEQSVRPLAGRCNTQSEPGLLNMVPWDVVASMGKRQCMAGKILA